MGVGDMNKRYIKLIFIALIVILTVFAVIKYSKKTIQTSSGDTLSNKKIGWGIKRNDNHEQPDLGSVNKKMIDENDDIAMGNSEKPYIYLSFDEGYEAGYTSKILDILSGENQKNHRVFFPVVFLCAFILLFLFPVRRKTRRCVSLRHAGFFCNKYC